MPHQPTGDPLKKPWGAEASLFCGQSLDLTEVYGKGWLWNPKVSAGPPCPTLLRPAGKPPLKRPELTTVSGMAHPQGGRLAAVFYFFGHPSP
jgi:hypothetical protein